MSDHAKPSLAQPSWWQRRVMAPLLAQLRQGITPEKLALTLALGGVIGILPVLGATTLLCGIAGVALRLNQPLIQVVNYLVYPLQIALLLPFMHAGAWLGAPELTLSMTELMARLEAAPGQFILDFGLIGLGAVGIWLLVAPPLAALTYFTLRPMLRRTAAAL
jgi:uncharacterized protein (DUF2062 family)